MSDFTIADYQNALLGTGRTVRRFGKNLVAQCLAHTEKNPSMEVFSDGWCQCYAGCNRFHISKYFDEFKDPDFAKQVYYQPKVTTMAQPIAKVAHEEKAPEYKIYDLYSEWLGLREIPDNHEFKGIPLDVLSNLGWRWTDGIAGMGSGYFIPYFNGDKSKIPFAQVRHLTGERRFTMLPGAEVTAYGKWNISDGARLFVVEGCSDAAVLDYAGIPWIAIPTASGGTILKNLAKYALKHGISLIYAGDNDEAGDKLKAALDEVMPFRACQPPKEYKDWGDFLVGADIQSVISRCYEELIEPDEPPMERLAKEVFGEQNGML